MKKLIIAAIALISFSTATFAQAMPAGKKSERSKMQVVKKTTEVKTPAKVVTLKTTTSTVAVKPMAAKKEVKTVAVTKPAVMVKPVAVAKVNSAVPLKKDGTPDKRYSAKTTATAGPLKKDGTADMRYKANKKH